MARLQCSQGQQGAKRYLVRDRNAIYGNEFRDRIKSLGIKGGHQRAPKSLAECIRGAQLIGSIQPRAIMSRGEIVTIPQVGRLHRWYERRGA
jgi:hypothetical protein